MNSKQFMFIAGEASGDALAAELVRSLRLQSSDPLECFGAGGPEMTRAGIEVTIDMTAHSVIGLVEALKSYSHFKRIFDQLLELAAARKPDVIVCVDFSGFNRRFAKAVRGRLRSDQRLAAVWRPKIVQFVSPQVWASRPSRAEKMARDIDLLLCIFPFEKDWYAKRVPNLRVEFIGHPMLDRYAASRKPHFSPLDDQAESSPNVPRIVLLPGSRRGELKRHLPVLIEAARCVAAERTVQMTMVLANESLRDFAQSIVPIDGTITTQIGALAETLAGATAAVASTGTVTLECAYFGVPTVAIYKTSWSTFQIGRRIVQVKYLAMPNLLADEMIFPELIQDDATSEKIAQELLQLLDHPERRVAIRVKLGEIIESLGGPGASGRAARAILDLKSPVGN